MATSGGHPGHPNEDFAGAVPGAAVLLDGAGIPGTESICCHGVAWYTHRLGGMLLGRLSRDDGRDLTAILAAAIGEIAADHRGTCDITHPSSPQATVVVVRLLGGRLDYLLLADCFLVLGQASGEPLVITDEREVTSRRICSAPLAGLASGTAEYERVRASYIKALQARRNKPGGYWIAKDDPHAAEEAVTGSFPLRDLNSAALLSNGASRIVDPYALTTWSGMLELLGASGPAEIIRHVRRAEAHGSGDPPAKVPDDATAAHCTRLQESSLGAAAVVSTSTPHRLPQPRG